MLHLHWKKKHYSYHKDFIFPRYMVQTPVHTFVSKKYPWLISGGGISLYKLPTSTYLPLQKAWFWSFFGGLNTGTYFQNYGLKTRMIFKVTRRTCKHICFFNSTWTIEKEKEPNILFELSSRLNFTIIDLGYWYEDSFGYKTKNLFQWLGVKTVMDLGAYFW